MVNTANAANAANTGDVQKHMDASHRALDKIESVLTRMGELAELSADDAADVRDRERYQRELAYLKGELDFICNTADYEGRKLFAGAKR